MLSNDNQTNIEPHNRGILLMAKSDHDNSGINSKWLFK